MPTDSAGGGQFSEMRRGPGLIVAAVLAAAPIAAVLVLVIGHDARRAEAASPLFARDQDYVGASTCRGCHLDHYASWRRTHHASMTQLPDRATVRGRFDGAPVTLFGATATPFERDGRFLFRLPAVGGDRPRDAEVALCVGSRRYQQYFERVDGANGTIYRRLPLLWHVGEARWLHLNGAFLEPDDDDWSKHQAVWNANCVFCHNTGIAPGLKPAPGTARQALRHARRRRRHRVRVVPRSGARARRVLCIAGRPLSRRARPKRRRRRRRFAAPRPG